MPMEYDSVISEELAEISKGLRKRHRTGVSGTASAEMMQLRNRTDELAEVFGSGKEENREKKIKDAYKASLNYEMMKREEHEEYDWEPDTEMGKDRMRSAKQLRELISAYFPDLAQQAVAEFREEKKNHKFAAAAAAVSDYAAAGADSGKAAVISAQREKLNARIKSVRSIEKYLDDQEKALEEQQKTFEASKKKQAETERNYRFAEINNGLNKLHVGLVAGLPSSELKKLRKAESAVEKAIKKANGDINDPRVANKMKAAYLASMNYELAKRRDDAADEWHPTTEMGRGHMESARNIRKYVAENHPEIAEEANREFLGKYAGKTNYAAAQAIAGYTDKTVKENKERLRIENIRERSELERRQASLDRRREAEAKKAHDLKITDSLDEINKGLNAVHKGGIAGAASSEMKALRKSDTSLKTALLNAEGNVNDPAVIDAMYNAYKSSLYYETLKRKNDASPDFSPSTRMGNERLESSRKLRKFVIEHCPDIAKKAAQDFVFERRGKKYGKTAETVANADKDSIDLYLIKQQSDLGNADVELDVRAEEINRRNADIELQRRDFELQQMQEEVRRRNKADEQQRKAQSAKIREGLYAKRKGLMTGRSSDEMKEMRQAKYGMDHAVDVSDGDLNDPRAEAAIIAAYKASMKYELYKRKNDEGASWSPSTDMGKKRMESSREIREYIAAKRPDLAEKAGTEFLNEYKDHKYNKALSVVVNYAKPFIAAAKKERENEAKPPRQTEFEARRELIARQRIRIEAGIMACERVKAQISGTEPEVDPKKQQEFAKQQEELDKQKAVLLRRQGELELRPDAEVPDVRVHIANEGPAVREEPELQRERPEAERERENEHLKKGEEQPEAGAEGLENIRNADGVRNLENAVIINNEVIEKAGEKAAVNEDKNGSLDLDHVIIVDEETNEVIEEIGGPQKPVFRVQKQEEFSFGGARQPENVPQANESDAEEFEIEYNEPKKEDNGLDENEFVIEENTIEKESANEKEKAVPENEDQTNTENRIYAVGEDGFSVFGDDMEEDEPANESGFEIIGNEPEKAPAQAEKKDPVIGRGGAEKQPVRKEEAQPVPVQKTEVKAANEVKMKNAPFSKTPEQLRYEKLIDREKEGIMHRLVSFDTDRENGAQFDRKEYKKTVAEAMAVGKLESMYKESGMMFEKTFSRAC